MKNVTIDYYTALEALEAMRAIAKDKNSYIHQRYTDDVGAFVLALEKLKKATEECGKETTSR